MIHRVYIGILRFKERYIGTEGLHKDTEHAEQHVGASLHRVQSGIGRAHEGIARAYEGI